jgi:hypothetical protein
MSLDFDWSEDLSIMAKEQKQKGYLDLNYRLPMTIKKIKVKVSENIDTLSLTNKRIGYQFIFDTAEDPRFRQSLCVYLNRLTLGTKPRDFIYKSYIYISYKPI